LCSVNFLRCRVALDDYQPAAEGNAGPGQGNRDRSGPVSHSGSLIRTRVDPPVDDDLTVPAIADLASEDAGAALP
jgi:hypothetical protein